MAESSQDVSYANASCEVPDTGCFDLAVNAHILDAIEVGGSACDGGFFKQALKFLDAVCVSASQLRRKVQRVEVWKQVEAAKTEGEVARQL